MKKLLFAALIAVLGMSMVSCCGCGKGSSKDFVINGKTWALIEMNGTVIDRQNDNPDRFTLILGDENKFNGMGDCNRYFGSYTMTDNGELKFSAMGSTRAMCPNQKMEDQYFQMLNQVTKYKVDGEFLILMNDDNQIIASMKIVK